MPLLRHLEDTLITETLVLFKNHENVLYLVVDYHKTAVGVKYFKNTVMQTNIAL